MKFEGPVINKKDGKHVYIYNIAEEDYQKILDAPEDSEMIFSGSYLVVHDTKFWSIPLFAIILVIFALAELTFSLSAKTIEIPDLGILIAIFSFSFLVLALHREDYEIPLPMFVYSAIASSILVITFILVLYLIINITTLVYVIGVGLLTVSLFILFKVSRYLGKEES